MLERVRRIASLSQGNVKGETQTRVATFMLAHSISNRRPSDGVDVGLWNGLNFLSSGRYEIRGTGH